MVDVLDLAERNHAFAQDCMENPEVFRSAVAIVDRFVLIYGHDIKQLKLEGPMGLVGEFDVMWTLGVREA